MKVSTIIGRGRVASVRAEDDKGEEQKQQQKKNEAKISWVKGNCFCGNVLGKATII